MYTCYQPQQNAVQERRKSASEDDVALEAKQLATAFSQQNRLVFGESPLRSPLHLLASNPDPVTPLHFPAAISSSSKGSKSNSIGIYGTLGLSVDEDEP